MSDKHDDPMFLNLPFLESLELSESRFSFDPIVRGRVMWIPSRQRSRDNMGFLYLTLMRAPCRVFSKEYLKQALDYINTLPLPKYKALGVTP